MARFILWILGTLAPVCLIYLIANFITWGGAWDIGTYQEETRGAIAIATTGWSFLWGILIIDF